MIYFENDLFPEFSHNGGVYVRGNGSVLEDIEFKDGKFTDMECRINYMAPALYTEEEDGIHFSVEKGISQFYCRYFNVCPKECKNVGLKGQFTYEEDGSVKLQELVYSEHKCDEEGEQDNNNGFKVGIGDTKGRVVPPEIILFQDSEHNNGILDIVLFVPEKLIPESVKQKYETKLERAREA